MLFSVLFLAMVFVPNNLAGQGRGVSRDDGAPKVGDIAPTFKLATLDGSEEVDIAQLIGKRPIILIFGSYT